MIPFDIAQMTPQFLMNDKNGYALAKAIEAGMKYFLDRLQAGIACVKDVESMPEWRLDEMAWELGCLYDYNADMESKRRWIREATPHFAAYGTPKAIYNYLDGLFDDVLLEESWLYGGETFHFRVIASGEWTKEKEKWALGAIGQAKNVRSVLDGFYPGRRARIGIQSEGGVVARFPFEITNMTELDKAAPEGEGATLSVDTEGNAVLSVGELVVDDDGNGTLTGATLTVDADGNATIE